MRQQLQLAVGQARPRYNNKLKGESRKPHDLVWLFTLKVPSGTSKKLHNPWTGPWTIKEVLSEVLFRIETTGAWSKRPIHIVTSIDRLQRYRVKEGTTALDRLPLGQDYRPEDFDILDEFLESSGELPGPTKDFESRTYPPPDDFEDPVAGEEDPPRPPSPVIPCLLYTSPSPRD